MTDVKEGGPRAAVIGAQGMVGRALAEALAPRSEQGPGEPDLLLLARPAFDLLRPANLDRLPEGLEVVYNAAAYTDVDGAEADEAAARALNGEALGPLAARCRAIGALLVHLSTDYVFDGRGTAPYPTDAPRAPINAYGRSKALGEEILEASGAEHLIVRTSWVYAPWGKSFVRTIAGLAEVREALDVVTDQRGRPTSATHLARHLLALVHAGARGIHHLSDGGECTWFELAQAIVEELGAPCVVRPCTSEAFPRPAPRPAYSVLDLSRAEALIGPIPHWREPLRAVLRELRAEPRRSAPT